MQVRAKTTTHAHIHTSKTFRVTRTDIEDQDRLIWILTHPPGPASLSASGLLFWTRHHGTTAETCGWLQEKRVSCMSAQRVERDEVQDGSHIMWTYREVLCQMSSWADCTAGLLSSVRKNQKQQKKVKTSSLTFSQHCFRSTQVLFSQMNTNYLRAL